MNCEHFQVLMMGFIDNELTEAENHDLKEHLAGCKSCRIELERYRTLQDITNSMAIETPEDKFWDGYWAGIYNRMERNMGWFFSIVGSLVLISGGAYLFCSKFIFKPDAPIWLRCGVSISVVGLLVLFCSAARERYRAYEHERYKDVWR